MESYPQISQTDTDFQTEEIGHKQHKKTQKRRRQGSEFRRQ
jgi:hypothetical protein